MPLNLSQWRVGRRVGYRGQPAPVLDPLDRRRGPMGPMTVERLRPESETVDIEPAKTDQSVPASDGGRYVIEGFPYRVARIGTDPDGSPVYAPDYAARVDSGPSMYWREGC